VKILALITARGGSKRLPGKNLRLLGEKPLIVWSIDVTKGIGDICDILVSTDDEAIAKVARDAGALVPWLRPAALASDNASSVEVCLHALDWYEREYGDVDGLMLLQPTSPFRRRETELRGIELFRTHQHRAVIGVSLATAHPLWCFRLEEETMRPFVDGGGLHLRSQDLPPAYVINGALYLIAPADLRKRRSFFSDEMLPMVMDRPEESIDIDTDWDWNIAQATVNRAGQ
jgi:N-acylneuraminate cytidylyltransferase